VLWGYQAVSGAIELGGISTELGKRAKRSSEAIGGRIGERTTEKQSREEEAEI
jgi:hypothetical protein